MALSTLSPPPLPSLTAQSSPAGTSSSSSLPRLLHSIAAVSFPANHHNHYLSTTIAATPPPAAQHKWRTQVSFFTSFLGNNKTKSAEAIKEELLEAIATLDRGAEATPEDQQKIDQIARKLEALSPTKEPLKSDLLNGKWELIYTTSQSILQTQRPKFLRSRRNFQAINVDTLRAQNMESWPFFNQVTANLTPLNPKKVAVQFDVFKIGGFIPIKAPGRARGELEITYLDEELRVSRGDKGNLFILTMVDPSYRVPT
ncbi:probable plastid-lipid-associated protein 4, chloroplastic isoform X2 [Sesamum indicum]|uniref:Probable plastid-lipid-associated protein 4, chloroplastic isoform X1 n=1 Tax=Sesamum indicum TaxID=4182 RepID=A0A6I9TSH4_SESIN|nr:probable plastid-lipid-associated protein 4, chloroplastic isoform X1 [Sesamum indicum]XP_011087773.1 probable plastid-lipid-associated protein 4, chloroplastic isoform X2 [Sesamum indicum]